LAQLVCKKQNISLGELRSGSRRRDVTKTRGSISWIAVRELGYSGADVARYFGVTNSCVIFHQSLLFAKAFPEWDFRYLSNESALALSLKDR
jgi:hypothetical protein